MPLLRVPSAHPCVWLICATWHYLPVGIGCWTHLARPPALGEQGGRGGFSSLMGPFP